MSYSDEIDELTERLGILNKEILELEDKIADAKNEAQNNIEPLTEQLSKVKEDKRTFASKNDFESVQNCIRRENNLKFKINAQWNKYALLKEDLTKLNKSRDVLESKIKLKKDRLKRNRELTVQMDRVLKNYKKSRSLKQAAIDSKINYVNIQQWMEWGENSFNQASTYFYTQKMEIDKYFRDLEAQELKKQMDDVIGAYGKTGSLKRASQMAGVSYDTVQYWYDWGMRGFGEENTYFYKRISDLK